MAVTSVTALSTHLYRFFDVRPGEARSSLLGLAGILLFVIAGHTVMETARDALLLTGPGPRSLGAVYIAIALGTVPASGLVARASAHPNIRIVEHQTAIDLIMLSRFGGPDLCAGAYVLDEVVYEGASGHEPHPKPRSPADSTGPDGKGHVVETYLARATVLASGGAGKVYLYTTNPDVATGDGVAMAYRAGAEIANMEFYQFHPTCLYNPQTSKGFLISEALRGEGAVLRLQDGTPFMKAHDPRGDLAPRDKLSQLLVFAVSDEHAELRRAIGMGVGSTAAA